MNIAHFHFGRECGSERLFVQIANVFYLETNKPLCSKLVKGEQETLNNNFLKEVITDAYLNLFNRAG